MTNDRSAFGNWLVVFLLMGTMTFSLIDRFALSLMVDPIRAHYDLADRDIGLINGLAFGLFYSVMGVPFGLLADRWSRKGTIITGVSIWSVATAMCGLSPGAVQFAISRTLVGAGEASLAPAGYSIIYDRFSKRSLARAIAVFQFGAVIGSGLALLVGGAVYRYFLDGGASFAFMAGLEPWQKTFIALASPGLVMVTLLCLLRDKPSHEHVTEEGKGKRDYGPILRNMPQYVLISLGMSLMAVASYGCLSWMPTIIAREFGWSAARIGSAYGILMIVVSPPGLYLGGWLSDTLVDRGYRNAHALVALLSACVTLPPAIALVFMGSPVGLLCMVGIIHFGVCLAAGSTPAYIQIVTPRHARSLMSGIYILVLNAMGLGVGPTLIGYLSSRNGDVPEGLRTALTQAVIPALILSIILVGTLAWRERTSQAAPALDGAAVSG